MGCRVESNMTIENPYEYEDSRREDKDAGLVSKILAGALYVLLVPVLWVRNKLLKTK